MAETIPGTDGLPNYLTGRTVGEWTGMFDKEDQFQAHTGYWSDYVWLMILGSFAAFMAAWGIGANDVANSFATSVGAKSVTMFQACIIAGVFEFVGAVSLGGSVTKTVKGSITDPQNFKEEPQIFAYGMLCAAISVATVLFLATYLRQAVSTTHTVIGSVLGFGLVYGGADGITWNEESDEFPFRKGFTPVVISWFLSPVFTAIISSAVFLITRHAVLRRQNSYQISFYFIPLIVLCTIFIVLLAIFLKGVSSEELPWDEDKKAWVAIVVGVGAAAIATPYAMWLRKKMMREDADVHQENMEKDAEAAHIAAGGTAKEKVEEIKEPTKTEKWLEWFNGTWIGQRGWVKDFVSAMTYDVHAHVATLDDPKVAKLHAEAEVFDPRTEDVFKHMQVITACGVAFVHGANDVANGVGPLAGIWQVYTEHKVQDASSGVKASQPRWILVIGAFGIVFGLAMYGYRIIATLGVDLVCMTPSRGYAAELAATAIIALASTYGLPVSTTQVITGGEIGIGMCETWKMTGVNWLLFIRTFFGWVGALVTGAILCAFLFSIGVYGPSITNMDYVLHYQDVMKFEIGDMIATMKASCGGTIPGDAPEAIRGVAYGASVDSRDWCALDNSRCPCAANDSAVNTWTIPSPYEGQPSHPVKYGELEWLDRQYTLIYDVDKSGEINQYNLMFIFRQVSSMFRYVYSSATP
ncbi:sodium-coupled phosphate transporter protein [Dunaliella salina]|uniref:Phosphate transporter n=1 Tax=Dunaliella salina TaxID=3046 RepID=A0ABQ7GMX6_DUNSA|nr:sodium-coupled phosphate transporter protein [Dunaliella salina]|eukprot:KAF5835955.1 sodium-coupled phosphate transporter protein [Dunaliella salina]